MIQGGRRAARAAACRAESTRRALPIKAARAKALLALLTLGTLGSAAAAQPEGDAPPRPSAPAEHTRSGADAPVTTKVTTGADAEDGPDAPALPPGSAPRPLPNYRGRASPRTSASLAAWVPRLVLAPAYVAGDMVARPLARFATWAEKHHVRERVHDFFTFGPDERLGLFPAAYIDLGFRPSWGAYFFWKDMWRNGDLNVRVLSGGGAWWDARARHAVAVPGGALALTLRYVQRDLSAFHGLGRDSRSRVMRFGEQHYRAQLSYVTALARDLSLTSTIDYDGWAFDPHVAAPGEETLAEAIAAGRVAAPPALTGGVRALTTGLWLDYDSREGRLTPEPRRPADYAHVSGTGVALHVNVAMHSGLARTRAAPSDRPELPAWVTYGASATGTLDVTGTQRRLELELYSAFADPLPRAGEVPFTEAVSLGGGRPLRGFGTRRLVDRSAAAATLRYRWPIWSELDGVLHYAVGNVFGARLSGIAPSELRSSFGVGLASATSADQGFEFLFAFGTRSFGDGAAIESTRLAVGTTLTF